MSDHLTALEASRLRQPLPEVIATEFDDLQAKLLAKLRGSTPGQISWFDWLGLGTDEIRLPSRSHRSGQAANYAWSHQYHERAVAMWRAVITEVATLELPRLKDDEVARWLLVQGQHHEAYVREAIGVTPEQALDVVSSHLWRYYGHNMMTDVWLPEVHYAVYRNILIAATGSDTPDDTPRMWATLLWQHYRRSHCFPDKPSGNWWLDRFFQNPIELAQSLVRAECNQDNAVFEYMIRDTIWQVTPNNPIAYRLLQQWWMSGRPDWTPFQFRLLQLGVYHNRFVGWGPLQSAAQNWLKAAEMPADCTPEFLCWVLLQLKLERELERYMLDQMP